jgi:hypothetical protein
VLRLPFGAARAVVDPADGAVLALEHPARPGAPWLLDEGGESWHSREHRWGSGLLIASTGAGRWNAPAELEIDGARIQARHRLAGLELHVTRELGETWRERYVLRNPGPEPVTVTCLGISTPWRDLYVSATDALRRAVHAHVHAGGAYSYTLAEPMDGAGPVLGLALREGELWAYSIESREPFETSSNARGHVVLHATDAARAPHAFGGQPELVIAPGGEHVIAWELAWHADRAAFLDAHPPPFDVPELVAEGEHGETYVERGRSRIAIARHAPLGEIVRRRIESILEHQRATHRAGAAAGALLPYDTERGLTVPGAGWQDFSDGRERIGMGLLLQEALRHGHAPDGADGAAEAFRRFVTDCLLTDTHELRSDSHRPEASPRLYDIPWLVLLLAGHDPDRALAALRGFYERGGERFLAIGAGIAARELAAALRAGGRDAEADEVDGLLRAHAAASIEAGEELPAQLRAVDGRATAGDPLHGPGDHPRPREAARARRRDRPPPPMAARLRRPAAARPPARHRDPPLGRLLVRPRDALGRHVPPPLERADGQRPAAAPGAGRGGVRARARRAARRDRGADLRRQPDRLRARRQRHRGVRVPELRVRPSRAPRRPAGQRPGLGALLAAAVQPLDVSRPAGLRR